MSFTLQHAKMHLGLYQGTLLRLVYTREDKSVVAKLPSGPPKLAIDHIISLDEFPTHYLIVGLGRPSSMFSGTKLALILSQAAAKSPIELMWPVRQLANLCDLTNTRYGYIQTDEELVVFCFSKSANVNDTVWKAAMKPIPYSKHGPEALTTDLALWWLCMLAMSGQHNSALVPEDEMVKIDDWDFVYLDAERGWSRRHRYSNLELPTDPPPPPEYRPPSPGNPAGFQAAVGLHADPAFELHYGGTVDSPDADNVGAASPAV